MQPTIFLIFVVGTCVSAKTFLEFHDSSVNVDCNLFVVTTACETGNAAVHLSAHVRVFRVTFVSSTNGRNCELRSAINDTNRCLVFATSTFVRFLATATLYTYAHFADLKLFVFLT